MHVCKYLCTQIFVYSFMNITDIHTHQHTQFEHAIFRVWHGIPLNHNLLV